jgi:hypothetical protein
VKQKDIRGWSLLFAAFLVGCSDGATSSDKALTYVADGTTTTPPASYVYPEDFIRPATIAVYESHPLHGVRVRTHVKYFTDTECNTPHNVALEIDVP